MAVRRPYSPSKEGCESIAKRAKRRKDAGEGGKGHANPRPFVIPLLSRIGRRRSASPPTLHYLPGRPYQTDPIQFQVLALANGRLKRLW